MKKLSNLIGIILLFSSALNAQNISGTVNNYAAVKNLTGTNIGVNATTGFAFGDKVLLIQMKGAVIDSTNSANFGNIINLGGAGNYEFATVSTVVGTVITLSSAPTKTYNVLKGFVQLVKVPKFCNPTVVAPITCPAWNETVGTGGIIAFEAGTLTLNAPVNANEAGFAGGNFALGSFGCSNGNYFGVQGVDGGQKGESISGYMPYKDGRKGKQANGGGGGNSGNSGGGGGGNGGVGGLGGNEYSGCGSYDDRGNGGLGVGTGLNVMYLGGGGGGGYEDNGQVATSGGRGGGIVYIKANAIFSNNEVISAKGESVTIIASDEASGGGGAGGSVFIECTTITGTLQVNTDGGSGGSNNNVLFQADAHGTGGGGGGGVFAYSGATLPSGVTVSSVGGAAGTVNNPQSSQYNTTYGATAGATGVSYANLPTTPGIVVPVMTVSQNTIVCAKQSIVLTAGGVQTYSWSTGATTPSISVSPTVNTSYTVTGSGTNTNSCKVVSVISLTVMNCTGLEAFTTDETLKVYPNPTSGKVSFETKNKISVQITDNIGKVILEKEFEEGTYTLDLSAYATGIYQVKVLGTSESKIIKLVKTE
ncbi:hypothetical protein CNR22_16060 [Sphingobacteriaceae bacterium]|nr:hypothetical protein CNR22_16060 [Sphingobacteriaceae bacterium]